jgi:oxygen-dependent protoporphyrinogen oxidase
MALSGIRRHLQISKEPDAISLKRGALAVPQYTVNHLERIAGLYSEFQKKMPRCYLTGNYRIGVSVDQCILCSKEVVQNWYDFIVA